MGLTDASWVDANWMFVGTALLPIVLIVLIVVFPGPCMARLKNPYFVGWLTVVFYLCHQFEEHGYDLRGWHYAFVPDFNHVLGPILFKECDQLSHTTCPLDPPMATRVNVTFVWMGWPITMLIAHYLGGPFAYAGLPCWGTCVANGLVGHILPMVLTLTYNPGSIQSMCMVPVGMFLISRCASRKFFAVCIVNGILVHVICFGIGINLVFKCGFPPVTVGVLGVLTNTIMPLAFAWCAAPKDSQWYVSVDKEHTSGDDQWRAL